VAAASGPKPKPGDRVAVGPLGLEGIVQSVFGHDAEVNVRGKRLRAALDELRVLGSAQGEGRGSGDRAPGGGRVSVNVQINARETTLTDLNVIGCSVDEALARTDKFIDEALVSELRTLRVIHGHGTGQLRRAIGAYLQKHPLVARALPAPPEQGGSGVTVFELKD
jgi:DNA mismatch repair protein MutS2